MKNQEIRSLLEKYYDGNTSKEEDKALIQYFSTQEIDPEFLDDKEYFEFLGKEIDQVFGIEDLSGQIWENIEKHEDKLNHKTFTYNNLNKIILAVAASIIIAVVSITIIKYDDLTGEKQIQFADTYDNPEVAYIEAKKALLLISQTFNKGTNHINNLESFEKGTKNLGLIENFEKGLYELKPVKSIEIADKYIKNK
jgi:hypothetical protein